MKRFGLRRLTQLLISTSISAWRADKAEDMLAAAEQSLTLWAGGGLDFAELGADIAGEVRAVGSINAEIDLLEGRIAPLFAAADHRPAPVNADGGILDDSDRGGSGVGAYPRRCARHRDPGPLRRF